MVQPILANDDVVDVIADKLTLVEAVAKAHENNIEIKKAGLMQEQAKIRDKQMDKIRNVDYEFLITLEQKRQQLVTAKQAESGVDIANLSVESEKLNVQYQVSKAYYNVTLKQEELENIKTLHNTVVSQADIAKKRYEQGLVSKLEYEQVENQAKKIELNLTSATKELEQSKKDLNLLMGQPLKTELTVEATLNEPNALEELNVEEFNEIALKRRPDLVQTETDMEIKKVDFELTARVYPDIVHEYKLVKIDFEIAKLDWENDKQKLLINLQKVIDSYYLSKENYELSADDISLEEEQLKNVKLQYDLGMVTDLDVLNAQQALSDAKLNQLNLKYQVWQSIFQIENTIGTKLEEDKEKVEE